MSPKIDGISDLNKNSFDDIVDQGWGWHFTPRHPHHPHLQNLKWHSYSYYVLHFK